MSWEETVLVGEEEGKAVGGGGLHYGGAPGTLALPRQPQGSQVCFHLPLFPDPQDRGWPDMGSTG